MILDKVINKKTKDMILKRAWPLVMNIAHLLEDASHEAFSQKHWMYLVNNIRIGDVLLSNSGNIFSTIFIPGKVKHAAIVTSENKSWPTVVEAVSSGVREAPLFDHLEGKKLLFHCRPKFISGAVAERAATVANSFIGSPYDHLFSLENSDFYCSELVLESYKEAYEQTHAKDGCFPLNTKVRYGEETYTPDDIRTDSKNWEVLWSNSK